MENTQISLAELKAFESALETFKDNILQHCRNLEDGISGCQQFMKDQPSQKALQDGQMLCDDIKSCLNPTEKLLDKIRNMISIMNSAPEE